MMTHEPARAPVRQPTLEPPQQPMLPFEQSAPASGDAELSGTEMNPSEVWEALPGEMKTEVRRGCLRTMREVIGNGPL